MATTTKKAKPPNLDALQKKVDALGQKAGEARERARGQGVPLRDRSGLLMAP